jgi:hypothetical protein
MFLKNPTNDLRREDQARWMVGSDDEESEDEESEEESEHEEAPKVGFGLCTGCGKDVNQRGSWCCAISWRRWGRA